jgi:hypothetical protein
MKIKGERDKESARNVVKSPMPYTCVAVLVNAEEVHIVLSLLGPVQELYTQDDTVKHVSCIYSPLCG